MYRSHGHPGFLRDDAEQSRGRSRRMAPVLFPVLKGLHADPDEVWEFSLRQASALADRAYSRGLDDEAARSPLLATKDRPAFTDAS